MCKLHKVLLNTNVNIKVLKLQYEQCHFLYNMEKFKFDLIYIEYLCAIVLYAQLLAHLMLLVS